MIGLICGTGGMSLYAASRRVIRISSETLVYLYILRSPRLLTDSARDNTSSQTLVVISKSLQILRPGIKSKERRRSNTRLRASILSLTLLGSVFIKDKHHQDDRGMTKDYWMPSSRMFVTGAIVGWLISYL